ncbi:MAG: nucleotidyltransferase family protein [Actinomycetota bacterium]
MARPHPVLVDLAAGRAPAPGAVDAADAEALLASALDHGMVGLLWTHVRAAEPGFALRTRLAGLDALTRRRHERLWDALAATRDRLATVGVGFVTIKGVTAEARWYGRAGERPSTDVDVLLAPTDLGRAGAVVAAFDPGHPLAAAMPDLVAAGAVQSVDLRVDDVAVDLHFDLCKLGYAMRDPQAVWARTREHPMPAGLPVRVLASEDALVHFLVHANKDSFPRLIGCADVVRVMAEPDLDWDTIGRTLRTEGLETVAARALDAITRALAVPPGPLRIPPGVRRRVWGITWPDRVVLLGSTGTTRSRRQEVLPFLVHGRGRAAAGSAVRIAFPAPAAVHHRYAALPGGSLRRLARGRWDGGRTRRDALRARERAVDAATPQGPGAGVPQGPGSGLPQPVVASAALLRRRVEAGPLWIPVSGRSMAGSIPGGTRVRLDAPPGPRRGEVWAFRRPDGVLVVHRVRRVAPDAIGFQGDGCVQPDPPVGPDWLVGRVVALAPHRPAIAWGPWAGALRRHARMLVAAVVVGTRRVRAAGRRTPPGPTPGAPTPRP